MSSHKNHEHLNRIKDAVQKSTELSDTDKSDTIKRLDEWILEDKAEGLLIEELLNLTIGIKPILAELGLI